MGDLLARCKRRRSRKQEKKGKSILPYCKDRNVENDNAIRGIMPSFGVGGGGTE